MRSRSKYHLAETLEDTGLTKFTYRLHKIALEVMPDPEAAYLNVVDGENGFFGGGSYLSCLGENVGVRKAEGKRTSLVPEVKSHRFGESHMSPDPGAIDDMFDGSSAAQSAMMQRNRSHSLAVDGSRDELLPPATNDGGKVKKLRRATSSLATSPLTRPPVGGGRRRGMSNSSSLNEMSEDINLEGVWVQDAGEAGTWTIASTGKPLDFVKFLYGHAAKCFFTLQRSPDIHFTYRQCYSMA